MEIRFVKPFRFIGNNPDDGSDSAVPVGHIVDLENDESTQWLIDNGFAEKIEENNPRVGDKYWYISADGTTIKAKWVDSSFDNGTMPIGNIFKTEKSAQRYVDYLKAVETVRHDEGFMKPRRKIGLASYGYAICYNWWDKSPSNDIEDSVNYAGKFYFDTIEHAEASIKEHESEWQTILDYDWNKE